MCCALFYGLFWQFKIWNLSKWSSVGPDGTYEYRLRHGQLARWIKWRTCDVTEAKEGLENELWRRWSNGRVGKWTCSFSKLSVTSPTSQLILQPFRRFTYITAHFPTLLLLPLCHSSFSKPSFASPTSQALHLIHLASHPWDKQIIWWKFAFFSQRISILILADNCVTVKELAEYWNSSSWKIFAPDGFQGYWRITQRNSVNSVQQTFGDSTRMVKLTFLQESWW